MLKIGDNDLGPWNLKYQTMIQVRQQIRVVLADISPNKMREGDHIIFLILWVLSVKSKNLFDGEISLTEYPICARKNKINCYGSFIFIIHKTACLRDQTFNSFLLNAAMASVTKKRTTFFCRLKTQQEIR